MILTEPVDEIAQTIDMALAGYADHPTPYLALFGIDPGRTTGNGSPNAFDERGSTCGPSTATIRISSILNGSWTTVEAFWSSAAP